MEALDRLFDLPGDADARSQEVYAKARALYAEAVGRRAEQHEQEAQAAVEAALDAYRARSGTEIRVRRDPAIKTDALVKLAWRYDRPYHEILVAGDGQNPALIGYSFERILMDEELRAAGVYRMFGTNEEMERGALRAIEKDLRRLHERQRVPTTRLEQFGLNLVRSLTIQLYNMPFDLFLQSRLHADFEAVRDAQFVWLARQMSEYVQVANPSPARSLIPQRMWGANAAMCSAFALLIDDLYGGRTAYAEGYRPAGVLDTGRKLYGIYRDLAGSGAPDAVYTLVDAWAGELRLRDWYYWAADDSAGVPPAKPTEPRAPQREEESVGHRTTPEFDARRVGGATTPDYLARAEVQMAAMFHLVAALERFSTMSHEQIFAVAGEVALLGQGGIDYSMGGKQYTLNTLPGEEFSGLELLCLEYVGFKLTHPELDTMIPFDDAYRAAKSMYDNRPK